VQGDPGEGKTRFLLAIAAAITTGTSLPSSKEPLPRSLVIFHSAEDGIADTLLARFTSLGGDSSMVYSISEKDLQLSMSDERIEQAMTDIGASLFIFDPLQAFLGAGVDMRRANEVRPLFTRLGNIADRTNCAIAIIGHLNKMSQTKVMYRGLGSADINAAVRSVLLVRLKDDPQTRVAAHLKSNLAPEEKSIAFTLGEGGFEWAGTMDITADELLNGGGNAEREPTKKEVASALLLEMLKDGELPTSEIIERLEQYGIGKRTAESAKTAIGAKAIRRSDGWVWALSDGGDAAVNE
jgi:hypothetical protein